MTEEFDEEVVFENSPLFQYLQDLGHTDFEACPSLSQEEERCPEGEEGHPQQDAPPSPRESLFWRLADAVRKLNPFHQGVMSDSLEQQLDVAFQQYSLRTILEQDVLLQEDVELIELLDPSILTTGSSSSSPSRPHTVAPRFLATPSLWDVSVLVGFVAVLMGLLVLENGLGLAASLSLLMLLGALAVLRGRSLWQATCLQKTMCLQQEKLEQLAISSRTLTSLARKSLRLIQETEVISRGFTLVSAACPFKKAGQPRGQQLLGLRKAFYKAVRAAFRAARLATCHMLKSYPLTLEIDNVTNYVSTVPLRELGLGLGEEPLSDEQAQELTDDYSLPALKVLFQLWVSQSSEFFRRLALLLSPGREEEPPWRASRGLAYRAINRLTEPLHGVLSRSLGDLQRSYDFHRYFEMQLQAHSSDRVGRARQKCCELNSLHTSVRSLQLHLKALLNEVIILEDELEKLMVSRETMEMTRVGYQELQDRLRFLQPHMQASASCWEETVAQVERMLCRATNCPGTPESPEERTFTLLAPPPRPITLIQDQDPVPEEQELEAYASDSDSDGEWRCSASDRLTSEERDQQRREQESSRRVLLELKSVLGLRASDVERQKWKQLLFSDRAALMPIAPATLMEPCGYVDPSPLDPGGGVRNNVEGENRAPEQDTEESDPLPTRAETEFCCGQSEVGEDKACAGIPDDKGETVHYQYDGTEGEGDGEGGTGRPLVGRPPTLSVMDRLSEIHGTATLSFSSALAAQVAARSHSFTTMEEQTFGDEDDQEEDRMTSYTLVQKQDKQEED
ncbi:vezatin isoform X2 [Paramormyrops kingsleyae]|uniref:vezatin isoform X2 n=1 Tax=Paramormyrops kingsleyae TaxID=1676925 RepID=UPI000CD601B6|nr:vezatin isoform X2 [Paramormyrops kingsleyae]